ncbi:TatD family hydrolase [Demequina activiva]|uniref:Hydrolase TatD n=1 Tax=Demequina activiva TaxID=1582364 RepID=A0A919Q1T0_9MICO|nr:TatD family hydrolase [Demequina activiva]GIG53672.1 hydrolase TatD [Demequina activiva]
MTRRGQWPAPPEALPAPIVDNHCHLEYPAGDEPRSVEDRLEEAARAGVARVVQIGCDLESARWTADAVSRFPQMLGGVALHPNDAAVLAARGEYDDAFAEVAALARGERIRVVGETGLDFFRTGPEGRDAQLAAFRDHIALAKELDLPLQIHDRDAHAEVIEVLLADGAPARTVFHCFSGDAAMARVCAHEGWYLSIAGTVTFKNADPLRAAVAVTPPERLLIETDAPFLTPHPHRGAPNAPAQAALTVREVARILEHDLEQMCTQVWNTSHELYGPW